MSQYVENLVIGDYIDVRGPNGLLQYAGRGKGRHCIYLWQFLVSLFILFKVLESWWVPVFKA